MSRIVIYCEALLILICSGLKMEFSGWLRAAMSRMSRNAFEHSLPGKAKICMKETTERNRKKQKETERNRKKQKETERNRKKQKETERNRKKQKERKKVCE